MPWGKEKKPLPKFNGRGTEEKVSWEGKRKTIPKQRAILNPRSYGGGRHSSPGLLPHSFILFIYFHPHFEPLCGVLTPVS